MLSRRTFLVRCSAAGMALAAGVRPAWAGAYRVRRAGPHPTPRSGITAANVLTKEQLADSPRLIELFDHIREIPEVVDGIRCQCGCAEAPDFYSLLTCYEGDAMARACPICQGQGRLVYRLHEEGKSLEQIRTAVDARYG